MSKSRRVDIIFRPDDDLPDMLDKYRRSLGWTWKRVFLIGFADIVAKQGDNPELVVEIADYLERAR